MTRAQEASSGRPAYADVARMTPPVSIPTPASSTGRVMTPEPTFCTVDTSRVSEEHIGETTLIHFLVLHSCDPDFPQHRTHNDEEYGDNSFDDMGGDEPDADEDSYDSERSSLDEFADWEWMEQIDGAANVDHKQVADCDAKLIRRARMRGAFWVQMEEPSEETSDLALEPFDRYGCLNPEYCDHEIRKGSGVWGQELDHGDILLFESLGVEPLWRHQGIGTRIVNAILDKARTKSSGFFAFAQPGYLTRELTYKDEKERSEAHNLQTVLAIVSHPSRHLDVAQDWDEPEWSKEEPLPEPIRTVLSTLSDPSASDVECVRQIQDAFPVEADASSRLYTDESGNTILHIAAVGRKAETISYILAKYPLLTGIRNAEGHTPREALESSLEEYRTRRRYGGATAVFSDEFEGFSQSDIACLAALTSTEIFDLAKLSNQDISAISSATYIVCFWWSKLG
ncbi:hypothetical protein QBC40DRAFT_268719 [Triangularia verruculosa]|uniref:Uncharacterized protein n=1 Tax=Triangularia verruculosa TaxID=2587418 RepID=A0AAN6X9S7_9PEZI|nr:hypothetical protein QBC40DRAFT_268719 [Triangularia verruculosa]